MRKASIFTESFFSTLGTNNSSMKSSVWLYLTTIFAQHYKYA